jgi:hypothetical protein
VDALADGQFRQADEDDFRRARRGINLHLHGKRVDAVEREGA